MAVVVKTIGTGAGRHYANFTLAHDNINTDTNLGDYLVWETYNDGIIAQAPLIANLSALGNAGTLHIRPAPGQFTGVPGQGVRVQATSTGRMLQFSSLWATHPNVIVEGFEVLGLSAAATTGSIRVDEARGTFILRDMIIHGYSGAGSFFGVEVTALTAGEVLEIENVLIYGYTGSGFSPGMYIGADDVVVRNCTVEGNISSGFQGAAPTAGKEPRLINCISINNVTDFKGTLLASSSNNTDSDGTAPATGALTATGAATFVDSASGDYMLLPSASSAKTGVDLSGSFTKDIRGVTRRAPWDRGAYEDEVGRFPLRTPYYIQRGKPITV